MTGDYADILHLPHPVSERRARMSPADRAAQFAPFAALNGYGDLILETGRLTQEEAQLETDAQAELDQRLQLLWHYRQECPQVLVTWFHPDEKKAGGRYRSCAGALLDISAQAQRLTVEGAGEIPFERLYSIQSPLFGE